VQVALSEQNTVMLIYGKAYPLNIMLNINRLLIFVKPKHRLTFIRIVCDFA
jgi:hypothetical protein